MAAAQIELSRPPRLTSYDVPAVRTFLAAQRAYALRRAHTNIAPATLVEPTDPSLLPSLRSFVYRSVGIVVAEHSHVAAGEWASWNRTLRVALESWASGGRDLGIRRPPPSRRVPRRAARIPAVPQLAS
jgi:hypothetical protein